jgi:hypothetical protein
MARSAPLATFVSSLALVAVCSTASSCAPRPPATAAAQTAEPSSAAVADATVAREPEVEREPPPPPADPFAPAVGADGILAPADVELMPAIGAAPLVRLLEPGTEPRSELRYTLTNGKSAMEMSMDLQLALKMGDQALPASPLPRMIMVLDVAISKATGTDAHVVGKLRTAKVEARSEEERAVGNALGPKLAKLAGLTTTGTFDRRGFVHDAKIVMPPDLAPELSETADQLQQSIGAVAVPMPQEPIGVGGSWRVLKRVNAGGVDTVQLSTYTVTARDGDAIALTAEVAQFAAARVVNSNGLEARILRYRSAGGGKSELRMSSPFSGSGSANVDSDIEMSVAAGGTEATMAVHATVAMTIGPKTKKAAKPAKKR